MFDWDRRNMNYVRSKDYAFRKNDAPVQSIDHRNCPNWSIKYVEYLSLPCNFKSNISFFFFNQFITMHKELEKNNIIRRPDLNDLERDIKPKNT